MLTILDEPTLRTETVIILQPTALHQGRSITVLVMIPTHSLTNIFNLSLLLIAG